MVARGEVMDLDRFYDQRPVMQVSIIAQVFT
jgi:hypothetical protein